MNKEKLIEAWGKLDYKVKRLNQNKLLIFGKYEDFVVIDKEQFYLMVKFKSITKLELELITKTMEFLKGGE